MLFRPVAWWMEVIRITDKGVDAFSQRICMFAVAEKVGIICCLLMDLERCAGEILSFYAGSILAWSIAGMLVPRLEESVLVSWREFVTTRIWLLVQSSLSGPLAGCIGRILCPVLLALSFPVAGLWLAVVTWGGQAVCAWWLVRLPPRPDQPQRVQEQNFGSICRLFRDFVYVYWSVYC